MKTKIGIIFSAAILLTSIFSSPSLKHRGTKHETNLISNNEVKAATNQKSSGQSTLQKDETNQQKKWEALQLNPLPSSKNLSYSFSNSTKVFTKPFPEQYQTINGILSFRGGPFRNNGSMGTTVISKQKLIKSWSFQTSSSSGWGGGSGWTGQPSVIEWKPQEQKIMNLYSQFKTKSNFKEVVYGSLDGRVYFLDLATGKKTRNPINIQNPIKGSVALDPRGYPLLYVGQGIPQTGKIGMRIFSLIDGSQLAFIPGIDSYSFRGWGAFDGSALFNREDDAMLVGGENGLVYFIKLNTKYDPNAKKIKISPVISKYRYKLKNNSYQGIENSVAVFKNIAYFSDNGGGIQALDIIKKRPIWANNAYDDTDASIVIENSNGTPFLYTGSEIDKQGTKGYARIQKLNGLTGKVIWEKKIPGYSIKGNHPVNGGLLATPIVGTGPLKGQVIFNISRYKTMNGGLLISYDTVTGKEKWHLDLQNYAWSSTVAVYTKDNKAYLIQGDSVGNLYLISGSGKIINKINLGANIEASPVVVGQQVIVGTRGGKYISVNIQ
ncbi:PQQ-binding-like beta-propeller repeat protein [Bacillus sp. AFS053548]|uniref:PQQ-binding-like beta-propeller repeat protein n=1 Tax=Bacillus sp. AFS053548 TaxID=2033505 RepID=UPI000BFE27A7|nr:PQQ-binding-like beta-propeller repeat protein [Bacillus sp. AFS053548]PGM59086.1 pyrrolo-quinoline quinone [Bacillus sp. AFS053548]